MHCKDQKRQIEEYGKRLLKTITAFTLFSIFFLQASSNRTMPLPTAAPTATLVPYSYAPATPTPAPITPTPTSVPLLGPMPPDATGNDMVLMQYTKKDANGATLVYSQELGMWMELHSPPEGIFLIDQRIAFYSTPHDLIPVIVEADPALNWKENLVRVDQSAFYPTDRLKLVSFSSTIQIELAMKAGIDLQQKNTYQDVANLMENIKRGTQTIQFRVPGDSQTYTWILNKGVRVWLVKDGFLDPKADASVYTLNNGDQLKIFAKDGVLEYIVSTTSLGEKLQQDGVLAKVLAPTFEVLLSANGKLPTKINSYYDLNYHKKVAGDLADMAGPTIVGNTPVPVSGFIVLVGR